MSTVLVIEDEQSVRENLVELLEAEGYSTLSAKDGEEGAAAIWSNRPDLVLCDVRMPRLDGFGLLARISQDSDVASIPFIFLTARSDRGDLRTGMELGADDYITKPFTRSEILNAVRSRLEKRQALENRLHQKMAELRRSISFSLPHELLTPLSVILGFSELLVSDSEENMTSAQVREMGREIHRSGMRLLRTIQNYLQYAELEALDSDPARLAGLREGRLFSVRASIEKLARMVARERDRGGDIHVDLQDACLAMDESFAQKICEELLENAIKFSNPGSPIEMTGEVLPDQVYHLCFTDHGRGMSPEQIADIGGFMQFDRTRYEQQGSGLGLALALKIVQLHNGRLEISSKVGAGTSISVYLPICPV